ncbi:MAG: glycosyltransferase [Candidatus Atribacteria bacterium]|nr:glycosyltransferase [Candidatus Atribacteria bacterium]
MKILFIISGLPTGGAEMMLYKLLLVINRDIFEPVVISLADYGNLGNNIKNLNIPVYKMEMSAGFPNPFKVWRFIKLIRKINPELIQGWMYYGNLAALLARWFLSKRVSQLWSIRHTPDDLKKEKRLTELVIRLGAKFSSYPDRIIYNSNVSEQKHELLGYNNKNKSIIPNGFNCEQFKPFDNAKSKLRHSLGLKEDTLLIGLVARYHRMKDHVTFLHSAGEVIKIYPKVHFVLVGSSIDEKNQKLVKQIKDLKLMKNVHLLGERKEMNEITAGLDIACSSSSWGEGFSNAIGEAMACGVPCVVTDIGDSAWIVGETGIVVKPGDRKAFTDTMITLIKMSSEERLKLGKLARNRIIEYFSINRVVKQYEDIYQNILNIKH